MRKKNVLAGSHAGKLSQTPQKGFCGEDKGNGLPANEGHHPASAPFSSKLTCGMTTGDVAWAVHKHCLQYDTTENDNSHLRFPQPFSFLLRSQNT